MAELPYDRYQHISIQRQLGLLRDIARDIQKRGRHATATKEEKQRMEEIRASIKFLKEGGDYRR